MIPTSVSQPVTNMQRPTSIPQDAPEEKGNPEILDISTDLSSTSHTVTQSREDEGTPIILRPFSRSTYRVVILGHSFIYWAGRYATSPAWPSNLGLGGQIQIDWRGQRGMSWNAFSATAHHIASIAPIDILLVHLGGNDLTIDNRMALSLKIIADLQDFKSLYPHTHIIWSCMLPRFVWRGAHHPMQMDNARRCLNREVIGAMRQGIGSVIPHPCITISQPYLFRDDGIHLSIAGLNVLLSDFRYGIGEALGDLVEI